VFTTSQNFFEIFLSSFCRPPCNSCVFHPHSHPQFHIHWICGPEIPFSFICYVCAIAWLLRFTPGKDPRYPLYRRLLPSGYVQKILAPPPTYFPTLPTNLCRLVRPIIVVITKI
jgi:hypothetical protein